MNADPHTVYEVDYSITGVNPEEVEFKATQSEHVVTEKVKRSLQITLESSDDKPASFCWRRTDKKSKKLDSCYFSGLQWGVHNNRSVLGHFPGSAHCVPSAAWHRTTEHFPPGTSHVQ